MTLLLPVVLSGGAGSRLWPVSREGHPKPFMKLADGQSLLEKTYRRAANLSGVLKEHGHAQILTVTNRDYYFMSRDELEKVGAQGSFLLEPFGRNTAPAIALAAHFICHKYSPDALMLVLPADHLILNEEAFSVAVSQAAKLAQAPHHMLVTFGMIPSSPATGFGYIESGVKLEDGLKVANFIEKPDAKTAQSYLECGNYFWNSGMFCFSAGALLKQLKLCAPPISETVEKCWQEARENSSEKYSMLEIPAQAFKSVPDISIDYAVMEKSEDVAVVPGDFGWSDVGSWEAIRDLAPADENNNRTSSDSIFINSNNVYAQSENRLVAAVGVRNLMIIDTKDALLVVDPSHSQEVKSVVNLLKQKNHDAYKLHSTVVRPWGTYTVLEQGSGFKIKRIEVKPGGRLSLQSHEFRSEHWVVVQGQAHVFNGMEDLTILANESTYIPAGHKHRLENQTNEVLVMIEVQCGSYLGEDDIERFDDIYGRN